MRLMLPIGLKINNCKVWVILCFLVVFQFKSFAQTIIAGEPVLEEKFRREQLIDSNKVENSFLLRPISKINKVGRPGYFSPVRWTNEYNTKRPYGWGNYLLKPNVGFQSLLTFGFEKQFGPLYIRVRPEFTFSQNKAYQGYSGNFPNGVNISKYHYWNNGDYPERYAEGAYSQIWFGQSLVSVRVGPMEVGVSTQNIWWGPGQFNDLTFSSNSKGFPHLTLNSFRPIKTFIGNFETQIIMGRLSDSNRKPSQIDELNERYFEDSVREDRYLNAFMITYNPKWVPYLYVGIGRTFQRYYSYQGDSFTDYFPIFQAFQKEKFFENGNSVSFDGDGFDQQLTLNFRYLVPKAKFEIYFEYGRRDHAFNYREFILNPEHARAYLYGFQKLFPIQKSDFLIQIRSELLHQQSSVNRYIRYPGLLGGFAWNTHDQARGFTQEGEALGVGSGIGSNVQTMEIAMVKGYLKRGILLERVENQMDFYYAAFGRSKLARPWIDLSLGLLWDQQWNNLILSGKAQFIKSYNYQWEQSDKSTLEFPKGYNPFAFYGSLNLIYRISGTK